MAPQSTLFYTMSPPSLIDPGCPTLILVFSCIHHLSQLFSIRILSRRLRYHEALRISLNLRVYAWLQLVVATNTMVTRKTWRLDTGRCHTALEHWTGTSLLVERRHL